MIKNKQTFSIRETVETLVPDSFGRTSYLIAACMISIMLITITLLLNRLPGIVPLFFSMPWGEARLAPRFNLYLLPLTSLFFLIANLMLGRISVKISPILPKVLAVSSAIVTFMMLVSLFGIVQSLIL